MGVEHLVSSCYSVPECYFLFSGVEFIIRLSLVISSSITLEVTPRRAKINDKSKAIPADKLLEPHLSALL